MKNEENTTMPTAESVNETREERVQEPLQTELEAVNEPAQQPIDESDEAQDLSEEYTPDGETEEELFDQVPTDAPDEPSLAENSEFSATPAKKLPMFKRLFRGNAKEEKLASMELICEKSGLSENDIYMLFELGYENELGRLVGYENLKQLKSDLQKVESQRETHRYLTSFGYRGANFVSNKHRESIIAAYVRDRRFEIIRLMVISLCTVLLFFIDQPLLLEGTAIGAFALQNGQIWDGISLALLIPAILLSIRPLYAGLRSFFAFSPTPYSFPAILTPIAFIYSIVVIVLQGEMLRVNFLLCCVLLMMSICDMLRLTCELRTFRMLSTDEVKHVLTEASPSKKKLRHNNHIVKIMNDDLGKNIYELHQTQQTIGFFRRFNAMDTAARPFSILIVGMLSLAILFAFVATIYTDSLASALSLAITTLMISMPATFFLAFFYPLCRANRILSRKRCALIGEESVEELRGEKTVVMRDVLMYNAEKIAEVTYREKEDFRRDLRLAGALFRKLGGTLKKIGVTRMSSQEEPQISITRIHEFGIEATADGRTKILAGSVDFLRYHGVRLPRAKVSQALTHAKNTSVVFVAINGVLKLSYEIEYTANSTFEKLVRDLAEGDTLIAISSYDPNLNEAFLKQTRDAQSEHISIRKPGRFEEDHPLDKADTTVVALNEETDVAYPLYAAKGIATVRHFGWRMQLISSILGALAVLLLMLFNPTAPLGISSILAYQALWVTVFTLSVHTELSESRFRVRR